MFIVTSVYFMHSLEEESKNAWLLGRGENQTVF